METDQRELAISVEEAARRLGIGRSLAYSMANDGRLPTIRLGRRLMVSVPALRELVAGAVQENSI